MAAVLTNVGVREIVKYLSDPGNHSANWRFRLYTNVITPLVTSVVGDFTEPANTGYAARAGTAWPNVPGVGGVSSSVITTATWTFDINVLGETVRGWFLEVDRGGTWELWAANNLATPYAIPAIGGSLARTFSISAQSA